MTYSLIPLAALAFASTTLAQPPAPPAPTTPPPAAAFPPEPSAPSILDRLQTEAAAIDPLVKSDAVKCFLKSVPRLLDPTARTVWRTKDKSRTYSEKEYPKLTDEERKDLIQKDYPPEFYYLTGYGTPLMYARPLDLYAQAARIKNFTHLRIADFGYGAIGHLRLLALQGARTIGIDVEPVLRAVYDLRGDTGDVFPDPDCVSGLILGRIDLANGRWPADKPIADQVAAFAKQSADASPPATPGLDLFLSKNTLKRGYIHPAREVEEKFLVKLGVDDATFCRAVFDSLKPGGHFLIYNLSPAQNPADKPYLAHADGQCPFERSLLEKTGFQVIEFDKEDRDTALDFWMALKINGDKPRDETRNDLFAWYTLCRKPAAVPAPDHK